MTEHFRMYAVHPAERILKEQKNADVYGKTEYTLRAAKGCHVSFQVVVAAETGLKGYSLKIGDFKDEKGTAAPCTATVYCEKYLEVEKPSSGSILYPAGKYPDALVPLECVPEQEKRVNGGENQAFYLSVYVPDCASTGEYRACVSFTSEKLCRKITVRLFIYDAVLPKESTNASCYCLRYDLLADGEEKNDWNTRKKYYDFLLEYGINAYSLPMESMDGGKFAETVKQYFGHPKFKAYGIPCVTDGTPRQNVDDMLPLILGLAEKSTEKTDLFSKAYCYFYDEPEEGNHIEGDLTVIARFKKMLEKAVRTVEKNKSGIYENFKRAENWKDRIRNIRILGTIYLDCASAELQELTDIWVPSYISFDSPNTRRKGMALAEHLGAEVWWYGCMGPHYPYPTYHMTDRLLSCRTITWMQKRYGVKGHLYWLVNGFRYLGAEDSAAFAEFDVYRNAHRREDFPSGDGLLVYPAARYGGDKPFPSLRLENLREGLEDFELLALLEKRFVECERKYDGFSAVRAAERLYDLLFQGMMGRSDTEEYEIVRKEVLETLSDTESGFAVGGASVKDNEIILDVYVPQDCRLIADGIVKKTAEKYEIRLPAEEGRTYFRAKVEKDSRLWEKCVLVCNRYEILCGTEFKDIPKLVKLSKGSSLQSVNYGRNAPLTFSRTLQLRLLAKKHGYAEIRLPFGAWKTDIKAAKRIRFDLANAESRSLTVFVYLYDKEGAYAEQAKEFFADSSMTVCVELEKMREMLPDKDFGGISVKIRNTYPRDNEEYMSVFLNCLCTEY